ncbi:MAG: hypothetical protein R3A50_06090 [Saprospiraceae bacterium]|nr:hypothetical protein [Saprospiraceae bacterium]MCB9342255.1 GNAT family N-acetyltransferase [Lewinellaceae bacterium]
MFAGQNVVFTTVSSQKDISQILDLQAKNLEKSLNEELALAEGFVTVEHAPDVLWRMNLQKPSIIAKYEDNVIAYALIMPRTFVSEVPILKPMFDILYTLKWRNAALGENEKWFVMGQVCIERNFRGCGVFDGLYTSMADVWASEYDFTVTEVAERNTRSVQAHKRVGFKTIYKYKDNLSGETWLIMLLEF